jgi:hypothetical protein
MFKLAFALWLTAVAATALRNDRFEIIEPPLNRSPISRIVVLISTLPLEHRVALRYRSFYQNMQQLAINQRDSPSQLWIADIKDLSAIQESIAAIKSELCGRPIDKVNLIMPIEIVIN